MLAQIPDHVPSDLVLDVDIYDLPGREADPHLAWRSLHRPGGPGLVWTPHNGGHWIVTSGALLWTLLPEIDRLSAKDLAVPPGTSLYPLIPNQSDEPEHRHYRATILPYLNARVVRSLTDQVRGLAIDLIESLRPKGGCEFMTEFARHLPMRIFLGLVRLPETDREWLIGCADTMVRNPDAADRLRAQSELEHYLNKWVEQRRAEPGDDLLSAIIHASVGDRPMTYEEIMGESMDVLFGGLDTVASMMGFVARFLATHPGHRQELIDDPALIPSAIEELFRRHGVATVARRVTGDIDHGGVTVRAGDMIVLPTCMHGLDEAEWDDALTVDFHRRRQPHATFGYGVHNCPGATLARSEMRIFLEEWLKRIPHFRIREGTEPEGLTGAISALAALHLEWDVG